MENNKKYLLSSISSVTLVNIFSMLVTAFLTLVLPRYIDKLDYSIWQLFLFYQGYLGFFHFGWNDGIYLRYGGKEYTKLNKGVFFSQFWMQVFAEILIAIGMCSLIRVDGVEYKFVVWQLAVNTVILNSRYMLIYILQTTARIKEYSRVLFCDRFLYIAALIFALLMNELDYTSLIYAETFSKFVAYLLAIYFCKDIVFNKLTQWVWSFREIWDNINVGIKILFSNIASILLIGIVRFGIEQNWSVEVFGEISLTITLSQLFITFITNIGMVIFPLLKQMNEERMKTMYNQLYTALSVFLLCGMALYYPGRLLLECWLPEYASAIKYMGILLPICYYESKMGLLNNTYLKALRAEKKIMIINCSMMGVAAVLTLISTYILKNLGLAVLVIVAVLCLRCIGFEKTIDQLLLKENRHVIFNLENLLSVCFVCFNYLIGGSIGFVGYFVCAIVYFVVKVKKLKLKA